MNFLLNLNGSPQNYSRGKKTKKKRQRGRQKGPRFVRTGCLTESVRRGAETLLGGVVGTAGWGKREKGVPKGSKGGGAQGRVGINKALGPSQFEPPKIL